MLLDCWFDFFFPTVQSVIRVRLYLFKINVLINLFEDSAASCKKSANLDCTELRKESGAF